MSLTQVVNNAGYPIELFWIDTFSNKRGDSGLVPQSEKPMRNGSDTTINSYNTHTFRVQFLNANPSAAYAEFTKGPKEETVTVTFDGTVMHLEKLTRFDEVVRDFKSGMTQCGKSNKDGYHECLVNSVFEKTQKIMDQNTEIVKYRDFMSERLRNYTCADPNMQTTESIASQPIVVHGKKLIKEVLLDKDHAKIWYVRDFISPEECEVLRKHGKPRLSRATVAAADGSSIVSENRKANQAHYDIRKNGNGKDPLG